MSFRSDWSYSDDRRMRECYEDSTYISWGAAGVGAACGWFAASSRTTICTAPLSGLPALVFSQWRWRRYNAFHNIYCAWPFSEWFRAGLFVLLSYWHATLGRRIRWQNGWLWYIFWQDDVVLLQHAWVEWRRIVVVKPLLWYCRYGLPRKILWHGDT